MELRDDDLEQFEAHGAAPLSVTTDQGYVDHAGARIWYATHGAGFPVIMLHGGLGHSGNWGLIVGRQAPARVAGVFFFGCNMDPSGTKEVEFTPILQRCITRHKLDYTSLSPTPDQFDAFSDAVGQMMRTEPNYSPTDLADVHVPVAIVQSEHDEFIKPEHAAYLARSIPGAELILLQGVSHFAPLQRPVLFNSVMLAFLGQRAMPPQRWHGERGG